MQKLLLKMYRRDDESQHKRSRWGLWRRGQRAQWFCIGHFVAKVPLSNGTSKMKSKYRRRQKNARGGDAFSSQNGSPMCPIEVAKNTRLVVTSEFIGRRHIVLVGDICRTLPFSPFQMLCELVCARRLATNGYLEFDDCETAGGSHENFYQLAYRIRRCLGGIWSVEMAPKRYRLSLLPENIEICPKLPEMTELGPKVATNLRQCLNWGPNRQHDFMAV